MLHTTCHSGINRVYDVCLATAGKGTYKWKNTGCLYDGDWRDDNRNGFGTYSIPTPQGGYIKQYSGGWKDDKKHVRYSQILYLSSTIAKLVQIIIQFLE